jgi:hypothetical protein
LKKRKWVNLKASEEDCEEQNVAEHVGHAVVIKFRRVMATRSRSLFCGLKPAARVEHGGGDKDSQDAAPVILGGESSNSQSALPQMHAYRLVGMFEEQRETLAQYH